MWLINTETMQLEEFLCELAPKYAILSHTWGEEEVTFEEMTTARSYAVQAKKGYAKIAHTCRLAHERGLGYAWVDTCCIDKSSSSELSEAINSMYRWYERAEICFVHLSDLPHDVEVRDGFPSCKWFTRGWTLQELLASVEIAFFDAVWKFRGFKRQFCDLISTITQIDRPHLLEKGIRQNAAVAVKMSWASRRKTTRVEDMAYCLLGIFDINMPLLYGEGTKSFRRLQEEIVKRTNDLTLFAWKASGREPFEKHQSVLAPSPVMFDSYDSFGPPTLEFEFSVTNNGIQVKAPLYALPAADVPHYRLFVGLAGRPAYLILQKCGPNSYIRDNSIHGGVYIPESRLEMQTERLEMQAQSYDRIQAGSIYLATYLTWRFAIMGDNRLHSNCLRIELASGLKVFQATPPSHWDPAHSLFLSGLDSCSLLIGSSSLPYGSTQVVILNLKSHHFVYVLPASSPAVPFITENLDTLTGEQLERFWDLQPLDFVPRRYSRDVTVDRYYLFGECDLPKNVMVSVKKGTNGWGFLRSMSFEQTKRDSKGTQSYMRQQMVQSLSQSPRRWSFKKSMSFS